MWRSAWVTISRLKASRIPTVADDAIFKKCISLVDLVSIGLSSTIGTGIHVILGQVASENAGPSVVISFLLVSVATLLSGLCYGELAERFPGGGSCYAYVYSTIGEIWAFLVGWNMVLELIVGSAVASKAWVNYVDTMLNGTFGNRTSIFQFKNVDIDLDFFAFGIMIIIASLTSLYIKILCVINNVLVIGGLLIVGASIAVGMLNVDSENWTKGAGFFPKGLTGLLCAAATGTFAFVGFETMAMLAKETQSCYSKTHSTATTCVFFVGLLSCFTCSVALTAIVPYSLLSGCVPLIDAFQNRGINGMKPFVVVGAACSLMAAAFSSNFSVSRLIQTMASDGLLLTPLGQVSTTRATPWISSTVAGTFSAFLALLMDIQSLIQILGIGTLLSGAMIPLAVIVARYRNNDLQVLKENLPGTSAQASNRHELRSREDSIEMIGGSSSGTPYYGSFQRERSMREISVDFIEDSYYSNLIIDETSGPTKESWKVVKVSLCAIILFILLLGAFFMYGGSLDNARLGALFIGAILILTCLGIIIARQPRYHRSHVATEYKMPCIPFLPVLTASIHLLLMTCLPVAAWSRFFVWSLMGLTIYCLYGVKHSKVKITDFTEEITEALRNVADSGEQEQETTIESKIDKNITEYGKVSDDV